MLHLCTSWSGMKRVPGKRGKGQGEGQQWLRAQRPHQRVRSRLFHLAAVAAARMMRQ